MLRPYDAVELGRHGLESAGDRVRGALWSVVQCALAAGTAWAVASSLLGHDQPLFACVAAVICLGVRAAQRLRRVAELAVGVTLGVAVGDLAVTVIGAGAWQIALVVGVALLLAVWLNGSPLFTAQAGLQAVFVVALPPVPGGELARWQDAMVGGATALAVAALLPADAWGRPRRLGRSLARDLAQVLRTSADAARTGDSELAGDALDDARALQRDLATWDEALATGRDISRLTPFQRTSGARLWLTWRQLSEGLERAAGNLRVLVRRVLAGLEADEPLPECLPQLLDDLAAAVDLLGQDLEDRSGTVRLRLARFASRLDPVALHADSLSGAVAVAQLRTAVVDLLEGLGADHDEARAALPVLR